MTCAEPTSSTEESVLQGLTRRVQKLEAGRCWVMLESFMWSCFGKIHSSVICAPWMQSAGRIYQHGAGTQCFKTLFGLWKMLGLRRPCRFLGRFVEWVYGLCSFFYHLIFGNLKSEQCLLHFSTTGELFLYDESMFLRLGWSRLGKSRCPALRMFLCLFSAICSLVRKFGYGGCYFFFDIFWDWQTGQFNEDCQPAHEIL